MNKTHKTSHSIKRRLQRLAAGLLAMLMIFGCAVCVAPSAGAADFSIDTTKFKNLEKSADTIYY